MAFFKKTSKKAQKAQEGAREHGPARNLSHILSHARITEKASMQQEAGVYTFDIADGATKRDVIAAVKLLYKVTPRLIRVLKVPQKVRRNARTGKVGIKSGGKKAYIYLKKGETITIS